jgi:hypothetical protein
MPTLTDLQRIELAIPAYLLYAIASAPDAFTPADPTLAQRAEADITELCGNLRTACLEPFADLVPGDLTGWLWTGLIERISLDQRSWG